MMDKRQLITKMATDIVKSSGNVPLHDDVAECERICTKWYDYALSFCNRNDCPPVMAGIVSYISAAEYNRRGDEGAKASTIGGQAMTYEDLTETMHYRLLGAGLRIYKI